MMWVKVVAWFAMGCLLAGGEAVAGEPCKSLDDKKVKVEAWLSKRYAKDLSVIVDEFAAMGDTRVSLWVYPGDNPSQTVAIGRCVPAYIARHLLINALRFSKGVSSLVHQGFVSTHWVGVAMSLFDENSQRAITTEQLMELMDPSLDTESFQILYRKLTYQDKTVRGFGLDLPNPKYLKDFNREYYQVPPGR